MDCDRFSLIVDELARDQTGDAGLKEHALDHAQRYSRIRLGDQLEVSASLAARAYADSGKQAPARVEETLLSLPTEIAEGFWPSL